MGPCVKLHRYQSFWGLLSSVQAILFGKVPSTCRVNNLYASWVLRFAVGLRVVRADASIQNCYIVCQKGGEKHCQLSIDCKFPQLQVVAMQGFPRHPNIQCGHRLVSTWRQDVYSHKARYGFWDCSRFLKQIEYFIILLKMWALTWPFPLCSFQHRLAEQATSSITTDNPS